MRSAENWDSTASPIEIEKEGFRLVISLDQKEQEV